MGKYIVQLETNLENPKQKNIANLGKIYDSENFNTTIIEIEEPALKENQHLEFYFDEEEQKVKAKSVDNEKTEEEKLKEEVQLLKNSMIELVQTVMAGE